MLSQNILNRFRAAVDRLAESGRDELIAQGHRATGALVASIEGGVDDSQVNRLIGYVLGNEYGQIVSDGVPASRVPFGRGSRGGRTSKYIEALLAWSEVVRPGITARERMSFVFAVANTHRREGISSRGSVSFSSNGRRKEWIKYGLEEPASDIISRDELLISALADHFESLIYSENG